MDGSVPLGGVYANVVNVWHTGLEFTLEYSPWSASRNSSSRPMRCTSRG